MRKRNWIGSLLLCLVLAACASHVKDELVTAITTMRTWKGQNIQVALDKLGPADNVAQEKKDTVYLWLSERQVNTELSAQSVGFYGHGTELSHANVSTVNPVEHCFLKIVTTPENIIQNFLIKGKTLGCQPLAEKINGDQ